MKIKSFMFCLAGLLPLATLRSEGEQLVAPYYPYGAFAGSAARLPDGSIYIGTRVPFGGSVSSVLKYVSDVPSKIYECPSDIESAIVVDSRGNFCFSAVNGRVYSINGVGTKLWEFSTSSFIVASPSVGVDGTIYIGGGDSKLHALTADGTERWSYGVDGWISVSAAIDDAGRSYFGTWGGTFYALNPDGSLRWKLATGSRIHTSAAIDSYGVVYFLNSSGVLYAVDTAAGTIRWTKNIGAAGETGIAIGPGGYLAVGTNDSRVVAINLSTGSQAWVGSVSAPVFSTPLFRSDGSLVVCAGNVVTCFSTDGVKRWTTTLSQNIVSSPVLDQSNNMIITGEGGSIYKLKGDFPLSPTEWPTLQANFSRNGRMAGRAPSVTVQVTITGP